MLSHKRVFEQIKLEHQNNISQYYCIFVCGNRKILFFKAADENKSLTGAKPVPPPTEQSGEAVDGETGEQILQESR